MRRPQLRTSLMLGAMALATATGAGVSAQGVRIDQMPGAYNRDEAPDSQQPPHVRPDGTVGGNIYVPWNDEPDSTSCGLGQRPSVVAVPAKGTIIESGTSGTRAPNPTSRAPDPQEIACVYARTFAAGTNGLWQWIGGGTVRGVQPLMNIELGRYEYKVALSSVKCTKTKAPGHRCSYTVTKAAVAGDGVMSKMFPAFARMAQPEVVTRSDQFVRNAGDIKSGTLEAGFAAGRAAYASSNKARYADERQRAEEERLEQMRRDQEKKNNCYYEQSMGLPQLNC